jgi:hypothetical protein
MRMQLRGVTQLSYNLVAQVDRTLLMLLDELKN